MFTVTTIQAPYVIHGFLDRHWTSYSRAQILQTYIIGLHLWRLHMIWMII